MELRYKGQFFRDLSNYKNKELLDDVKNSIQSVKRASAIAQIPNLKKLDEYGIYYRIRIAKDYRIGITIRNNIILFRRFGHRNNFYKKKFP